MLLVMVGSIFAVFFLAGNVFADGYGKEVEVNVMSYNIHHGVGLDGKLDLNRIAEVIEDAEADIIGIQEVDRYYGARSDFQDQAKELAKILGYHYVYGANLNLAPAEGREENRQYGTGILSKYPIIDSENILLNSFGNEQRGLLRAKINVRGVHVNFYNTHLGLTVNERVAQVEEINNVKNIFPGPSVLVGDLNAEPNSEEFQLLLNNGNFVDTFADEDEEDANTFPVIDPIKRIDYILTSPHIEYSDQEVIDTQASDHLPLVTELTIKR
ncbi:endonuclease/exonuclease/phosphatase family protein [Virgibacillus halodenitrificans]|uniref:endonuclease/exonuclease/phosphatase family protein n=1 Tax=Virgibacillus halodenitrificans TaxID=1482 RepID=UPI001F1D3A53|nr:endonuclease/exonuclease/phosphatase family protein [Virgibacillus halodenitrificans]